jgi:hypothetical protein
LKIELIVSPTGEVRLETHGFTGSSCRDASQFLEQALGRPVAEQLTAEYHQQLTTQSTELQQPN